MRRILISTLFLSAVLLHAQTATNGQSAMLMANAASSSASPATDTASLPSTRRISTGVVWPKLISEPNVSVSTADFPNPDLSAQHVIVSFRVNEKGVPENVHLLKSVNQTIDARVLNAVRQYRFEPGTLDDQKVAVDVNLVVRFQAR
jgi:TonB family protein